MSHSAVGTVKKLIETSRQIVVFTGAGVSTSCGIPDFRGSHGLYSTVAQQYNLPWPEALFELDFFKRNPEPFYRFSSEMNLDSLEPSPMHYYLAQLEAAGQIQLLVTQNIDNLHQRAGSRKIISCHGTYERGHCLECRRLFSFNEMLPAFTEGIPLSCPTCGGLVKPDITFFGETLPGEFYSTLMNPPPADLLLVVGTSLTVYPAAEFPRYYLQSGIPSLLINRDPTGWDSLFSDVLSMDVDDFVTMGSGPSGA